MIRALGFSENRFDAKDPGRLCRGRERWIEPWELEGDPPPMHRIVVSGATFSDDGAADARRGVPFSGLETADLVAALYPDRRFLAFMEDGHPADIPGDAEAVEAYEGYRAGGRQELGLVRWVLHVDTAERLRELLSGAGADERIRGLVVLGDDVDQDELVDRIFRLVGFSTLDSPPARYQPSALPELLELVEAVVLLHRDKHGPAVAVYAREATFDLGERLRELVAAQPGAAGPGEPGILLVPFAIPPMLARWDRALAELRSDWMATRDDEFPVPPAPDHEERRHRRWGAEDEPEEPPSTLSATGQAEE
jgi:hypothetical protein